MSIILRGHPDFTAPTQLWPKAITVTPLVPTLLVITRDMGSANGGTTLDLRGTNFTSDATVTIGGVSCTGVVFKNSTRVTVVAPAGTVGTQDVKLTQSGGSSTLAGAFEYLPAPVTTYVNTVFSGGTIPGGTVSTGTVATSTDFFLPNSDHSLKWTINAPGESSLAVNLANNPMAQNANGIYLLSYHLIPAATLAQYSTGQIKLHLCRVGNVTPDWEMLITGPQGPSSPRAADGQGVGLTSLRDNGTASHANSITGGVLVPSEWVESLLWYKRTVGVSGRVRQWINGKKLFDITNASYGGDTLTDMYQPRFGGVFEQLLGAQVVGYLGGMTVADGVTV